MYKMLNKTNGKVKRCNQSRILDSFDDAIGYRGCEPTPTVCEYEDEKFDKNSFSIEKI